MLSTPCPRCGHPAPLRLGAEDVVCPACRQRSALPPDVLARLAEADAVLARVDARRRQLGRRTRWLITHAGLRAGLIGCALSLLIVPFIPMAWFGWGVAMEQRGLEVGDLRFILPCATPLLLMLGALGLAALSLRRQARKVREACAAIPPSAPGEPARCHVCGGPVAPQGTAPIARCGYCRADNVVEADAMEAARRARGTTLDAFEAHLRGHADAAARGMRLIVVTLVLFSTVAPLLGICGGCFVSTEIAGIETEPHLDREYFWTAGPDGLECLGHVDWREATQARLRTPDCQRIGNSFPSMVENEALPPMLDVTALEGRHLVHPRPRSPREGRVVRIHGELDGRNVVTLRVDGPRGPREIEVDPAHCLCRRP